MVPTVTEDRKRSAYDDDHDDWTGFGEERVSGAWRRCGRRNAAGEASASQADASLLLEAAAVPDRCRGLRNGALLGANAYSDGARGSPHAPVLREAFVKRGKSDALDAEAICEAVQRPTMRFVPVKTVEQQGILVTHRARSLLVRQRTMAANALRAHLAEFGFVANPGIAHLAKLAEQALADTSALPPYARTALEMMVRQIMALTTEIGALDRQLMAWHAESEASRLLAAIPGLGVITATAIAATVADPDQFHSGRQFAAWLGLTPQQYSTGGKTRLGGISKQGDRYLRRLLVVGATAVIRHTKDKTTPMANWIRKLLEKKPFRVVSVALANKLDRIAWVVLTRKEAYRPYAPMA